MCNTFICLLSFLKAVAAAKGNGALERQARNSFIPRSVLGASSRQDSESFKEFFQEEGLRRIESLL